MSSLDVTDDGLRQRLGDPNLDREEADGTPHTMAPRRGDGEIRPEHFERVALGDSEVALEANAVQLRWVGLPWYLKPFRWWPYINDREWESQLGPLVVWGRERVDEKYRPLADPMQIFCYVMGVTMTLLIIYGVMRTYHIFGL